MKPTYVELMKSFSSVNGMSDVNVFVRTKRKMDKKKKWDNLEPGLASVLNDFGVWDYKF